MNRVLWIICPALIAAALACNAPTRPPETPTAAPPLETAEAVTATPTESLRSTPTGELPDIAGTLDALDAATPEPAQQGTITGAIGYPSEGNPAMRVYALTTDGRRFEYIEIGAGQGSYSITLSPGEYFVLADAGGEPSGFDSGYTVRGQCLAEDPASTACPADSSLIAVRVEPGQTITGIDLFDWFPQGASFPAIPG